MAFKDPHDPREFRQYISVNPDGTIAAVHEFVANLEELPFDMTVEVTDLPKQDFTQLAIPDILVSDLVAANGDATAKAQAGASIRAAISG